MADALDPRERLLAEFAFLFLATAWQNCAPDAGALELRIDEFRNFQNACCELAVERARQPRWRVRDARLRARDRLIVDYCTAWWSGSMKAVADGTAGDLKRPARFPLESSRRHALARVLAANNGEPLSARTIRLILAEST